MAKHVLGLWALCLASVLPARALRVTSGEGKNRTSGASLADVEEYVQSGMEYLKGLIGTAEMKAQELSMNPNMMRIPGQGIRPRDSPRGMIEEFMREMKVPGYTPYVPTPADLAGASCLPGDFTNTSTPKGIGWTILCFHLGMGWWSSDPYRAAENRFDIDAFVQCGAAKIGIKSECYGCLGQLIVQNVINSCTTCFYDGCSDTCKTCSKPGVEAFKTCAGGNWVKFGQGQICYPKKTTTTVTTTYNASAPEVTTTTKVIPGFSDLPLPGPWEKRWIKENWFDADSDITFGLPVYPTTTLAPTTTPGKNTSNVTKTWRPWYAPRRTTKR